MMNIRAKIFPYTFPFLAGHCLTNTAVRIFEGEFLLGGLMFLFSTGLVCNWLVMAINGWKMPVIGQAVDPADKIHVKMESFHRVLVLADRIPIGIGRASIGDLLMFATIGPIMGFLLYELTG